MRAALALCLGVLAACGPKAPSQPGAPATLPGARAPRVLRTARWSGAELARGRRSLRALLNDPVFSDAGVEIVAADGTLLFSHGERRSLVPASTIKLVVAAAALATLGPQRRIETRVLARAEPRDGMLPSPLWLVGGGDPALTSDDLRGAAHELAARGVRRIDGPLVVDATRFSGAETNPSWSPDDLRAGFAFAASALSLDGDSVDFRVTPTVPGAAARIETEPPKSGVRVRGTIETVGAGSPAQFFFERDSGTGPRDARGSNVFRAWGTVAAGETEHDWQPVLDLPRYAGHAFAAMLEQHRIALGGGVELGAAPGDAFVLWTHRSPPVERLVHEMLFASDNHTAEQLLRLLAADGFGAASSNDGLRIEKTWLARWNVPREGVRLVDGSGLSFSNRLTAASLAALLRAQLFVPADESVVPLMPRVGIEGTVRRRTLQDGAGRVRGKSGHLEGVNGLAGVVESRRHGPIVFSFLSNGEHAGSDRLADLEDLALDRLADF
jgi:D-alanyl-D-alanine carboxypeptidase/D-alanyl-D-alanine-endopeptidase (penicillin-binding protein 4)